jgi:hypothetical protein
VAQSYGAIFRGIACYLFTRHFRGFNVWHHSFSTHLNFVVLTFAAPNLSAKNCTMWKFPVKRYFLRLLCLSRPDEDGTTPTALHRVYKGGSWLLSRPEEGYRRTNTLMDTIAVDPDRTSVTEHLSGSRANIQVSACKQSISCSEVKIWCQKKGYVSYKIHGIILCFCSQILWTAGRGWPERLWSHSEKPSWDFQG